MFSFVADVTVNECFFRFDSGLVLGLDDKIGNFEVKSVSTHLSLLLQNTDMLVINFLVRSVKTLMP